MNNIGDLGNLIAEAISEYSDDVKKGIDNEVEKVGKVAHKIVKEKAPENTGAYKKAISVKVEKQLLGNKKATIYVKKPHYRLSHLLENGHALQNGGRTRAFKHWEPAERTAVKEFTDGVTQVIENGGSHEI